MLRRVLVAYSMRPYFRAFPARPSVRRMLSSIARIFEFGSKIGSKYAVLCDLDATKRKGQGGCCLANPRP